MARSAKAPHGAKSQAIREYQKANRNAKASEVVAALAEKGIAVTPAAVYNLRARQNAGKGGRKRGGPSRETRGKAARAGGHSRDLSIRDLLAAKKLVDEVGGVAVAREAIDALAKLV